MSHWAWWTSGLSLAGVAVLHWALMGRQLAVSGRFTAIVNRLRWGKEPDDDLPQNTAELMAALQAATEAEFGAEAASTEAASTETESGAVATSPEVTRDGTGEAPRAAPSCDARGEFPSAAGQSSTGTHVIFLVALVVGGLIASLTHGGFAVTLGLRSVKWSELGGDGALGYAMLLGGGMLVGFGTRMAGGCTSGHGLCGVSRLQRASLLATMAFFGAGVVTSLLLELP